MTDRHDVVSHPQLLELIRKNSQLELALRSRVVIEQAKGILAERYGLSVDAAFELLRRAARSNRMRIHDLARNVVEKAETPVEIEFERVGALRRRTG